MQLMVRIVEKRGEKEEGHLGFNQKQKRFDSKNDRDLRGNSKRRIVNLFRIVTRHLRNEQVEKNGSDHIYKMKETEHLRESEPIWKERERNIEGRIRSVQCDRKLMLPGNAKFDIFVLALTVLHSLSLLKVQHQFVLQMFLRLFNNNLQNSQTDFLL